MNYSKGPWAKSAYTNLKGIVASNGFYVASFAVSNINTYSSEAQFEEVLENNVDLAIAAVNGCLSVNWNDPLKAARGIHQAVAALREAKAQLEYLQGIHKRGSTASVIVQVTRALEAFE